MKKVFLIGFLLALMASVQAAEFSCHALETDCIIPGQGTYSLKNDSGQSHSYTIRAAGENKDWININGKWVGTDPLEVSLKAGETKELHVFAKPQTCYIEPGVYTITIQISNDETIEEEIEIEVVESRVLSLEIGPEKQEITECEKTEFGLEIENTGDRKEIVQVSLSGLPSNWYRLNSTEILLEKGQSKTVKLAVQPECSAETREYGFTAKAALKGTSFEAKKAGSLEIKDSQTVSISSQNLEACLERPSIATATIRNSGLLSDQLSLSAEGIGWAAVEPKALSLEAGEEKEVSIVFGKPSVGKGEYDFTLKAVSQKFGKATEKSLQVEVQDCYNVFVEKAELNGQEVKGTETACVEKNPVYKIDLRNDAVESLEAEVKVLGINANVSPAVLSLGPGEKKTVSISLDLSGEQPGEKSFTMEVEGDNVFLASSYPLKVENCFDLQVDWDGLDERLELDANCQTQQYTVLVKNTGTKSQSFSVELVAPRWFLAEPKEGNLEAGKETELYAYVTPPYDIMEGLHTANIEVKGHDAELKKRVEVMVFGGLYADLGMASVKAEAKVEDVVETVERTLKASIQLSNDSNALIRVNSLAVSQDFNAGFDFEETALQPNETIEVPMTLYLGADFNQRQFSLPLEVQTDKGLLKRSITIDLDEEPEEEDFLVGLFGLVGLGDLLLAGLVILIIVLFAAVALRSEMTGKGSKSGLVHLAKEVQELPGKKLEQIGKSKKAPGGKGKAKSKSKKGKPSSKNLQDIVKEVKKRPAKKKKKGR